VALVDTTAGLLLLLAAGVLAVVGLAVCIFAGFKHPFFFLLGLVMASPALWVAWLVFGKEIPRTQAWDLSASRGAKVLGEDDADPEMRERVGYTYSGNIHSSVRLSPTRYWSGRARSVYFRVGSGEITAIQWRSHSLEAQRAYQEARRVMHELSMEGEGMPKLDRWHAQVAHGGRRYFVHDARVERGAKVEISVTPLDKDAPKEPLWILDVGVWWNETR
jgi:hypothetical protein